MLAFFSLTITANARCLFSAMVVSLYVGPAPEKAKDVIISLVSRQIEN
jgi:hypothetical protein